MCPKPEKYDMTKEVKYLCMEERLLMCVPNFFLTNWMKFVVGRTKKTKQKLNYEVKEENDI